MDANNFMKICGLECLMSVESVYPACDSPWALPLAGSPANVHLTHKFTLNDQIRTRRYSWKQDRFVFFCGRKLEWGATNLLGSTSSNYTQSLPACRVPLDKQMYLALSTKFNNLNLSTVLVYNSDRQAKNSQGRQGVDSWKSY